MRASPAEEFGIGGGWVADDAEDDFAFDVDVGVVVPVELGRVDAVADEDDRGVDVDDRGEGAVGDGVVVAVLEVEGVEHDADLTFGTFGRDDGHGGFVGDGVHADHVDLLEVGAVVAAGLEAVEGELGGDVFGGELAAAEAGAAAFEEVVGEELDVGADVFGVDGGFGGFDGGRDVLRERGDGEEQRCGEGGGRAEGGQGRTPVFLCVQSNLICGVVGLGLLGKKCAAAMAGVMATVTAEVGTSKSRSLRCAAG